MCGSTATTSDSAPCLRCYNGTIDMARVVKSLAKHTTGHPHREHKSKNGRKKSYWPSFIADENRKRKLRKFTRKENKDILHE